MQACPFACVVESKLFLHFRHNRVNYEAALKAAAQAGWAPLPQRIGLEIVKTIVTVPDYHDTVQV